MDNDMDLMVCVIDTSALVIFAFQIDWYRRHNPGCTFRPITDEERARYHEQVSHFAAGVRRDSKRYALT